MNQLTKEELTHASQICGEQLWDFVNYVLDVDPELKGLEAIMIVAGILNQLPSAFANDPEMLRDLKESCATAKRRRK